VCKVGETAIQIHIIIGGRTDAHTL
jgi:hypothetical protein